MIAIRENSPRFTPRGDKFFMYRRSPSLQDYVLVSANKIAIDIFNKDDCGSWDIINHRSGDVVDLKSINLIFNCDRRRNNLNGAVTLIYLPGLIFGICGCADGNPHPLLPDVHQF
jgi:hypothetical protein